MKTATIKSILIGALAGLPFLLSAQSPSWSWATDSEGSGAESVFRMATTPDGSIYSLGGFNSPFTLGDLEVEETFGFLNFYLAKFSPGGNPEWLIAAGQPGFPFVLMPGLAADSEGNAYVSGNILRESPLTGEAVFSFGSETIVFPDGAGSAAFMAKVAPDGNVLWLDAYAGFQSAVGSNSRLAIDENDHIYIAASFFESIEISDTTLTSMGGGDLFLCRLDTDGNFDWVSRVGSPEDEQSNEMVPCQGGGVLMSSAWTGDSVFVGGLNVVNPDAINGGSIFDENNRDRWIAKINPDGSAAWLVREGGLLSEEGGRLASTPSGGAMVFSSTLDTPIEIGGQSIENSGWLLTRYSSAGVLENVTHYPTGLSGLEAFPSIIGLTDNSYLISLTYSSPSLTLGDAELTNTGGASGTTDVAIAAIDENGTPIWTLQLGADDSESVRSLAKTQGGEILVGGEYSSMELVLGEITLQNSGTFTNDLFVAKLDITSSILESPHVTKFNLFPNPAQSHVSLDLSEISVRQATLRIVDNRGAIAGVQTISTGAIATLDVSNLPAGMYAILIVAGDEVYASKLIKN